MKLDYKKISDVQVSGVDTKDYPDFVDAFIESASYDGREMTDAELDAVNENRGYVYECVIERIY